MIDYLRIGYRRYTVSEWTQAEVALTSSHGQCNTGQAAIYVCTDDHPLTVLDTLLHEILHAVWHEYGLEDKEPEEHAITVLATGLTQVLYDNPKLAAQISRLRKAEAKA